NTAEEDGGGIFDYSGGSTNVLDSRIEGNIAGGNGGGVSTSGFTEYSYYYDPYTYTSYYYATPIASTVNIRQTSVAENTSERSGGGIFSSRGAEVQLESSTVSGNSAGLDGGGLMFYAGDAYEHGLMTTLNTTISGNSAARNGGGVAALGFQYYDFAFRHSTITQNVADSDADFEGAGGGIWAPQLFKEISHSIVAENSTFNVAESTDLEAGSVFFHYSLLGDNKGSGLAEQRPGEGGSIIGGDVGGIVSPGLGDLADNGGPTLTHRLLPSSVAIDAGNPMITGAPNFDQRGTPFARIVGDAIDMGAFESGNTTTPNGDFDDDGLYDCVDIDMLVANVAFGPADAAMFDMTEDGLVNYDDVTEWLSVAGENNLGPGKSFLVGDANLDGQVDVADFAIWNANKFTTTGAWCSGDFNADGNTDVQDFNRWNANRFQFSAAVGIVDHPSQAATANQGRTTVFDRVFAEKADDQDKTRFIQAR
ncbi:MAG: choice-of-anchor Q domain-containing protein, partial [Planctomycetota bacterium]